MLAELKHGKFGMPGKRLVGLLLIVALPLLLGTGCTVTTSIDPSPRFNLTGTVYFGDYGLKMDHATVVVNGPVYRIAYTDYRGQFSLSGLPHGTYTVSTTTTAGSGTAQTIGLWQNKSVNLYVPYPVPFDADFFYDISGLYDLEVDSTGEQLERSYGNGTWRWPYNYSVPVYFDASAVPAYLRSTWINDVWNNYLYQWPTITGNILRKPYSVSSPPAKGITLTWLPAGSLGSNVAATTTVGFDPITGYLSWAIINIDVTYGDPGAKPVVGHEITHALGANHVEDENSILWPYYDDYYQTIMRKYLSNKEKDYIKYAYALVPKSAFDNLDSASMKAYQAQGTGVMTIVTKTNGRSTRYNGVPDFLKTNPVYQKTLAASGASASGFLWDEVGK